MATVERAPCLGLEARAVRFAYGAREVLRGVDGSASPGQVLGVLGPNGAGKSSLLRVLAGLDAPASGEVTLDGTPLGARSLRERARAVAYVPQRERSVFGFTVREVVALGRAPHTGWFGALNSDDRAAVQSALARCDLSALAERPCGALSGGEQQRVLVARALAQQAPWLLLDEPVASLDIEHQLGLCDLLAAEAGRGVGVVLVLHDLNLAAQYCDRVIFLRDGRVVSSGAVDAVMTWNGIRQTFGADVYVGENELNGTRYFVPMRTKEHRRTPDDGNSNPR